jgi:hypothetical protein
MVVKPPKVAELVEAALHPSAVITSPPEEALATSLPSWMYLRVIVVRVPLVVPSLVLNCVITVNGFVVSTVPPGP